MDSRAPEPLRVLIANERKERLQTTTGLVAAMGHEVIARSLEVSDGGFSTVADAGVLRRPVVDDERFGPAAINVAGQRREDGSLLNWFERLIRRRRECSEIGFGELELLDAGAASVLAHRCDWDGSTIVAVHELGGRR